MFQNEIKLYGYTGSSSTWRVRAALQYKQLAFKEICPLTVGTMKDYEAQVNPMGFVPAITLPAFGDRVFTESLPIIELLEETYHDSPKLMPMSPLDRYRVRQVCEIINAGMQPMQSRGTLLRLNLSNEHEQDHLKGTMERGLRMLENLIDENANFCVGTTLTMADLFFLPQIHNIDERDEIKIDISDYPRVKHLYMQLKKQPVFALIK
jgi:maleylacetoacetate isomerase